MASIAEIYTAQRRFFDSGATRSLSFRKAQLKKLRSALKKEEPAILEALYEDLRKHPMEAFGSEVGLLYDEINQTLTNLRSWMQPKQVTSPLLQYPSASKVYRDPKGLTLLIGPWNYPFQLMMTPLIANIAAGNCAILKPSELAPHTAAVTERMIRETFDPAFVTVITGEGQPVIAEAMQHRFDHIFFTGSIPVGRKILEMAAPHLTPVTLELGGKSPCVVDKGADIKTAAKRIIWGKCWNAGQTCIAPDYILVQEQVMEQLVTHMKGAIKRFFGEDPAQSPDYARIINEKHFDHLAAYLQQGRILAGGETSRAEKYIAPTLLTEVSLDAPIMQEEIFGPLLPLIPYKTTADALQIIARNPNPLSLYVFTKSRRTEKTFIEKVAFGGGCINNTLVHFTNSELPFGGVGQSGMGRYHGRAGFDELTQVKSVMKTATWLDVPVKYPPFGNRLKLAKMVMK